MYINVIVNIKICRQCLKIGNELLIPYNIQGASKELYKFKRVYKFIQRTCTVFLNVIV
jgi:hypothetical protein